MAVKEFFTPFALRPVRICMMPGTYNVLIRKNMSEACWSTVSAAGNQR